MVHVLFWNPDISSAKVDRLTRSMIEVIRFGGMWDWSFWDYEGVHIGDTCYLIRCNDLKGPHGVVAKGRIISEPYMGQDWSGRGRKIFYADWFPQEFIDTSSVVSPLTPEKLETELPDFKWRGGRSGQMLSKEYGDRLDLLWNEHLATLLPNINNGLFINQRANELSDSSLDFRKTANAFFAKHKDVACDNDNVAWDDMEIEDNGEE